MSHNRYKRLNTLTHSGRRKHHNLELELKRTGHVPIICEVFGLV